MTRTDSIARFLGRLTDSLADGTFVRLVLSGEGKILGRLIELKGMPHLSVTFQHATKDVTKNLPINEVSTWIEQQLTGKACTALLCTTKRDWQLTPTQLVGHKPSVIVAPTRTHDRTKRTFLDNSAHDWLEGLGALRPAMADKRRQIDRYLEILSHLAADCGWNGDAPLTIADMGCGKGYLTFGAWHWFRRVQGWPVRVIGVETRADLVETTNALARRISADGLEFVAGTIQSATLPALDALIALHACDTATDDAIRRGIEARAKLIVVAPCCHKEVRPQLGKPEPLASVLRHGLMEERMAEWVTDGLRALFLEWAGYRTKVMEFVAGEHTPKNLMIAAIREREPFTDEAARTRIAELKKFFGIERHALDVLLSSAAKSA